MTDPEAGGPVCLGRLSPANLLFSSSGHWVLVGLGRNFPIEKESGALDGWAQFFQAPELVTGVPPTPIGDYTALLLFMRSLLPYVETSGTISRFLRGDVGPDDSELLELLQWFDRRILGEAPPLRPSIEEAVAVSDRIRALLGVAPDPEGFAAHVLSVLEPLEEPAVVAAPERESGPLVLMIGPDAAWFSVPGGERQRLGRALRRILVALIDNHASTSGAPLSMWEILEAGWPGERPVFEAGANRVYVAIARLRSRGLRDVIDRFRRWLSAGEPHGDPRRGVRRARPSPLSCISRRAPRHLHGSELLIRVRGIGAEALAAALHAQGGRRVVGGEDACPAIVLLPLVDVEGVAALEEIVDATFVPLVHIGHQQKTTLADALFVEAAVGVGHEHVLEGVPEAAAVPVAVGGEAVGAVVADPDAVSLDDAKLGELGSNGFGFLASGVERGERVHGNASRLGEQGFPRGPRRWDVPALVHAPCRGGPRGDPDLRCAIGPYRGREIKLLRARRRRKHAHFDRGVRRFAAARAREESACRAGFQRFLCPSSSSVPGSAQQRKPVS